MRGRGSNHNPTSTRASAPERTLARVCREAGASVRFNAKLMAARADKERKFFELLHGDRCKLVVVALEIGGRWSLAMARAREAPPNLQRFSVLEAPLDSHNRHFMRTAHPHAPAGVDGEVPHLAELFSEE